MTFYLGSHMSGWLGNEAVPVPLFVSARRLRPRAKQPTATHRWALDSGGFTEIKDYGKWTVSPEQYADEVNEWFDVIGKMDWAAPQDWMCEPFILAKSGKTVAEHQTLTVENYLQLRELTPHVIPVLQGWELDDYLSHVEEYAAAGVDLATIHTVGVGSVCRRGQDREIAAILRVISALGIKPHGFGVRGSAYRSTWEVLASADSMAWSYNARKNPPLDGCTHQHCNNCPRWALRWRSNLLRSLPQTLRFEAAA